MDEKRALDGLRVVDFTASAAGPLMTKVMAAFGAEVIKVETSLAPDVSRRMPPFKDNIPDINRAGVFAIVNENKCSVSLNLGHPQGQEVARKLVKRADVVTENFSPKVMRKWGLTYDQLSEVNPRIVMLSASMQGQTGPHHLHSGYGYMLSSLMGLNHLIGWPDREPSGTPTAYTDYFVCQLGVAFILAALDCQRRTGKGQYMDLSQFEASMPSLDSGILDYVVNKREQCRMGNRHPSACPHGAYRCRGDERWCVIAACTDGDWWGFCEVAGSPAWSKDARFATRLGRKTNEDELDRLVERWTVDYPAEQVMAMMQAAGVPAGLVENARDQFEDPQLRHRRYFQEIEHPVLGRHTCFAPSFKLSRTPAELRTPAPLLGQHNEYVYKEVLGMSEDEYVGLLLAGAFE